MSERVGLFLRTMSTFLGGMAVAFWAAWDVALIMTGCLPFLALATWAASKVMASLDARLAEAYAQVGRGAQGGGRPAKCGPRRMTGWP